MQDPQQQWVVLPGQAGGQADPNGVEDGTGQADDFSRCQMENGALQGKTGDADKEQARSRQDLLSRPMVADDGP